MLGVIVSALLAVSEPTTGGETDCIWNALPAGRREALADARFENMREFHKAVPVAEIRAAALSCGGDFDQWSSVAEMAIQAAAERRRKETAIRADYSAEALDAAFKPLREEVDTFLRTPPDDAPGVRTNMRDLFKRFLANLGGSPSAADREGLGWYFQARVGVVLAEEVWRLAVAERAAEKTEEDRRP